MAGFDATGFRQRGFQGFVTVTSLGAHGRGAPPGPGVYVVLRESTGPPLFLARSPASWFKGKDPTVPVERLKQEWVEGASPLYVGTSSNLRERLAELAEFSQAGRGRSVRHWGGRMLWQVEGSVDFLVAWKPTAPTCYRTTERDLIDEFVDTYGRLPFANLVRPAPCG